MPKDIAFANVTSEIGTLKRLLVHSPDSGLGKVVPSKAQDWLLKILFISIPFVGANMIFIPKSCFIFWIPRR